MSHFQLSTPGEDFQSNSGKHGMFPKTDVPTRQHDRYSVRGKVAIGSSSAHGTFILAMARTRLCCGVLRVALLQTGCCGHRHYCSSLQAINAVEYWAQGNSRAAEAMNIGRVSGLKYM